MPAQTAELEQMIRERAYFLWEEAGRPEGRDAEFWLYAEQSTAARAWVTIFAYGSSMNDAVMTERCPGAQSIGQAYAQDQQLCFPRWSERRKSFVAGFRPVAGNVLHGVLWQVPTLELANLDAEEGYRSDRVNGNSYLRRNIEVVGRDGIVTTVQTYVAASTKDGSPSAEYLDLIVAGAEAHRLPSDYIAALRRVRHAGRTTNKILSGLKRFAGWLSPEQPYLLAHAMTDALARDAKVRAFRHAYRHFHREARRWRTAAFIPDADKVCYRRMFCRKLYPIARENMKSNRIRLVFMIGVFAALGLYCVLLPLVMPVSFDALQQLIGLRSLANPLPPWVGAAVTYAAAGLISFLAFAVWFDLFLLVGLLLIFVGLSETLAMVISFGTAVLIAVAIFASHTVSALPGSLLTTSIVSYAAAAFLGCMTIFGVTALLLAAIIDSLRRQSERLRPDANCVRFLFDALWTLQRAGAGWTSLATRSEAMRLIGRTSGIARRTLLPRSPDEGPAVSAWRDLQAKKICAALAGKQSWLITPKPDTREALFASLGPAIIAFLNGVWDNLELASESILMENDPAGAGHLWNIAADLLRTLLIAVLPTVLFLLANLAGVLTDVGAPALGYVKIGLFVWAALTVLFRLDPLLKEKLAALKEATQMLKPGGKKE